MPDLPEVGPWAKEKLDALKSYLDYYTSVLKNMRWRTIYVDAFAGGGMAKLRIRKPGADLPSLWASDEPDVEQQQYIIGSPRVALAVDNPFSRYVFIDAESARVSELEGLKAEYGSSRTISIRPEGVEQGIDWVLSQKIAKATHRGVAFLDPFGAHLPWSSIEKLSKTGLFEVIINFPLDMAINRLMKLDANIPDTWKAQLDGVFGESDWMSEAYDTSGDFFGVPRKRSDARERLLKLYLHKLRTAFGHVAKPKLITNTRGHPLYYLIWAGPNRLGLQGANYILGMSERLASGPKGGKPISS